MCKCRPLRISLVLFFLITGMDFSMAQSWMWAERPDAAGPGSVADEGWVVATDNFNNIFTAGFYSSSYIVFGSDTLFNHGAHEGFVVKYDQYGTPLWARSINGSDEDIVYGIATDVAGNVFITGAFRSGTLLLDNDTLYNNVGDYHVFIAKYDPAGNELWARGETGNGLDQSYSVAVDTLGNAYIAGSFSSSSITLGSHTLANSSSGSLDVFVAKYDAAGNVLWARKGTGSLNEEAMSISCDKAGNVSITGYLTSSTLSFGSTTLANFGGKDIFIARLDSSGNFVWARNEGGTGNDYAEGVVVDGFSNTYITGAFESPSISFGSNTFSNAGVGDVFITKYDSAGNVLWAQQAIGNLSEVGHCLAVDGLNNVYLTGVFYSNFISLGSVYVSRPAGSIDPMFIYTFSPSGQVLCGSSLASGGDDNAGVAAGNFGYAYICGDFDYVDPFIVGNDTLHLLNGVETYFIAKYGCGAAGITETQYGENLQVFPNPSNGKFTVTIPGSSSEWKLEVYNALGEMVYVPPIAENRNEIEMRDLPRGIYLLRVSANGKNYSQKIILE